VCAGVRAREALEGTLLGRQGFWPLQRTPLSPLSVFIRVFQKAKILGKFEV